MPDTFLDLNCSRLYSLESHPNLMGTDRDQAENDLELFLKALQYYQFPFNCYPYFEEFLCNVYFPQCNPESKSIVPPCREIFEEMKLICTTFPFFSNFSLQPLTLQVDLIMSTYPHEIGTLESGFAQIGK